ncbi:restriction endonuclease subunit S [Streptomyces sp. WI04-05A]|uniref:restriction endonuclease subunit S n=2 Tax=Streptomyces TaxID=1883 RepID=UPI0029BFB742|nr:restriction endonuclease subunit S [Streptomyces sp. WI04-05A]
MPEKWTMARIGWLFQPISDRGHEDAMVLSVYRDHGVIPKDSRTDNFNRTPENLSNYQLVRPGDLVVNRMKAWQGSLGISEYEGIVSPDYEVLRPIAHGYDGRFVHNLLRSRGLIDQYALRSTGIRPSQWRLYWDEMKTIEVSLPSVDEQRAIAEYLDRETARIDTLIEEQQRLIEMLSERRVATVAETLDGPERTQVRRLVNHDRPMTYGILQCGEPVDGGVVYIGPSDIQGEGLSPDRDALRTTAPEIASAYKRSVLKSGDVVVSIGPAYGKVAVVSDDLTGANLTQDTVRVALRPDLVDTRFFVWALLSRQTAEYWDYQIMGATFRRLNLGTLARTPIPLPAIQEQRRIAAYLDEQTAKIDSLIAETERFIDLARERRSALITAAVTGQVDVREAA